MCHCTVAVHQMYHCIFAVSCIVGRTYIQWTITYCTYNVDILVIRVHMRQHFVLHVNAVVLFVWTVESTVRTVNAENKLEVFSYCAWYRKKHRFTDQIEKAYFSGLFCSNSVQDGSMHLATIWRRLGSRQFHGHCNLVWLYSNNPFQHSQFTVHFNGI